MHLDVVFVMHVQIHVGKESLSWLFCTGSQWPETSIPLAEYIHTKTNAYFVKPSTDPRLPSVLGKLQINSI